LPRTGIEHFVLNYGGAIGRYTVSSRRLVGPVVVGEANFWIGGVTEPPGISLEFGWSTSPVTEAGVAVTAAKNWNTFHESQQTGPTAQDTTLQGFKPSNTRGTTLWQPASLNQIIPADECYLIVSTSQIAGAAVTAYGSVTFVEDCDRTALQSFR
jgi:hypothetical protein